MTKIKRIPYGKSDFEAINAGNDYYIDKTMYIPKIEETPFVFLIRPRRFGKSLFLSTLHSYYDINKKERFEEFYRDTYILENPTEERGKYMVMYFNFSIIRKTPEAVQEDFNDYCMSVIAHFVDKYEQYIPDSLIKLVHAQPTAHKKLQKLSIGLENSPVKMYILIDEYDNFTNTLLAEYGYDVYRDIARKTGYYKEFFTVLKALATGSGAGLARMFITGVSPITMDDVTSGMNIGNNISIDEELNEVMGFTEKDVEDIIDYYTSVGEFKLDKKHSMETMTKWYNGYKFAKRAEHTMYNTDMVLYYMMKSNGKKYPIDNLIDDNCKTDYGKFRHFTTINNRSKVQLNGNFDVLERIMTDGYINEDLVTSFPYEQVTESDNFVSLLFYFGLITIDKVYRGKVSFKIPNETVKSFLNDFIRKGYIDAGKVQASTHELVHSFADMMWDGEWEKSIDLIAKNIYDGMTARDKIEGERYIQAYFKALLGLSNAMIVSSEKPSQDGYADIALAPFLLQYPDITYGYLIEMKYLKAKDDYNVAVEQEIIEKATAQLNKYAKDKNIHKEWQIKPDGTVTLKKIMLVFRGRELILKKEITI